MQLNAHAQRGQTLPLWALSIAATLTLLFFVTNYASTLRWQIRAQNAADSAAAAGIATDANMYNEVSTLQFAAAVEEVRLRYLLQGILNTINHPSGCGNACDADYAKLVTAYNAAATGYGLVEASLKKAEPLAQGGLQNGAAQAVALASTSCAVLDCAFTYTATINSSAETVDVVACKKVPFVAPALFGQPSTASFTALGRSVATLSPMTETFLPGNVNPATGTPFQPDESPVGAGSPAELNVSFKSLSVNITWYVAGKARPPSVTPGYGCS